jgi:translocator protein
MRVYRKGLDKTTQFPPASMLQLLGERKAPFHEEIRQGPNGESVKPSSHAKDFAGLLGWLLPTFAAAGLGSLAAADAGAFYALLDRPDWAPPARLFGPVWSVLYLLMGVATWLVWREKGFRGAKAALSIYVLQLAANALWSWLFFTWRLGAWAFAEVVLLWVLIAATLFFFWRIRPLAGALLLPYLAWVSFATVLTYAVWQRNPQLLGYSPWP